ncbi:MAG: malate dehydrogenase [Candidatus Omnitrophica bacterium]|nr:malate dehydrogenase [Candidatus Omnitrophota bacterium]MBU1871779.1 malate dehydrogenase [Candidatus Omnitrophota bacterium]
MKISIIGAGHVGGLTAMRLSHCGLGEVVLIDVVRNLAQGKSLDINDSRFISKQNSHIRGTDDIRQISESDIVIITAGLPRKPGMTREELARKNSQIARGISGNIKHLCPNSIVIVVTNPLDAMTHLIYKETGHPANRVIGMGLSLDCARLANLICEELNVNINEIEPCIIGSHGEEMLPLARYTKVKGASLESQLEQKKITVIFHKTFGRGAEIVQQLGSGSAYFAPSAAIAELATVIASDEKRILPVSALLNGEYGLDGLCIGIPCVIGKTGIEKIIELELNNQEREAFLKSAASIKKQISMING